MKLVPWTINYISPAAVAMASGLVAMPVADEGPETGTDVSCELRNPGGHGGKGYDHCFL